MRTLAALFLVVGLVGCSTAPVIPERVLVPVPVPCEKPDMPQRPVLLTDSINKTTADDETAYAYKRDLDAVTGYAKSLEPLVGKCKKPNGAQP